MSRKQSCNILYEAETRWQEFEVEKNNGGVQGHPERSKGYNSQEFEQTPPSRGAAVLNNGAGS